MIQVPATTPLADVIAEGERIASAARQAGVAVKLVAGVNLHSASARRVPLRRKYGDLDFVAPARQRAGIQKLFESLGYQGEMRFNTLNGHQRLLYLDPQNGRQVDITIIRLAIRTTRQSMPATWRGSSPRTGDCIGRSCSTPHE